MATPYLSALKLSAKNNEAINQVVLLTTTVDGVKVPMDLTGYEFQGQARAGKDPDSALICNITITVDGPPAAGRILLFVDDTVVNDLEPIRGFYDVLYRVNAGPIDNLYMAPFAIEPGITTWSM